MLLLTLNSTYRTSVSSLEWHPTYVVRPVGRLMPLLSLFFLLWVSEWLCVCVFELCVCACVSSTVLLVSGFRDGAMCRNGPLRCLAGRPDPTRSTSITTWNLNVKHGPLLQPFVFLCGSVAKACKKQSPAISWLVWHGHGYILQHGNATSSWSGVGFKGPIHSDFSSNKFKIISPIDRLTAWVDPAVG